MTTRSSFLVGIFYPIIVLVAVLLLASVQLRSSSGSAFDTWRLNYKANRVLDLKYIENLKILRDGSYQNLDDLTYTDLCLKFFYDDNGAWKNGIDQQLLKEATSARSEGKKSKDYEGDMRCLLRGFTGLQYDKHYYELKKEDFSKDLADLQKAITANNDQHLELIKGHQDYLAFKEMENDWYSILIAVTPYDLMVLLMVMSMGALGGMVRLLRDYGDPNRKNPEASDYFFIPLIGLVVAIGGYILAKTGLLLLSSTKEETSLSPFMIGLVGIISGLLAKDVIDAIARAGAKIVNNQDSAGTDDKKGKKKGEQNAVGDNTGQ